MIQSFDDFIVAFDKARTAGAKYVCIDCGAGLDEFYNGTHIDDCPQRDSGTKTWRALNDWRDRLIGAWRNEHHAAMSGDEEEQKIYEMLANRELEEFITFFEEMVKKLNSDEGE